MIGVEATGRVEVGKELGQYVLPGCEEVLAEVRTLEKRKILDHFFTNIDGDVRAVKGTLPSVVAAALLARFSRAEQTDVTEVFWRDFVKNEVLGISLVAEELIQDEGIEAAVAETKARAMIRRIIDGYGDDSVREQASAYIVVQNASVLASLEVFLHPKLSGIEASTRYIPWGEKDIDGNYRYVRPVEIMDSENALLYTEAMDGLFQTYQALWQPVWDYVVAKNPKPEGVKDVDYIKAVRGRVCDNLRKLLPLGIKTNFGIHADMRTMSEVIMNLKASDVKETRDLGDKMFAELAIVNPEFVAVANSSHGEKWTLHRLAQRELFKDFAERVPPSLKSEDKDQRVRSRILNADPMLDLARTVVLEEMPGIDDGTLAEIAKKKLENGEFNQFLLKVEASRKNRRHKVPNAYNSIVIEQHLEGISFGSFKDFNRQRPLLFKSKPDWQGESGIYIPDDIREIGGVVLGRYIDAQYNSLAARKKIAETHSYLSRLMLTHGTKTSVVLTMGMGEAIWIEELRSIASGDPEYRRYAQEMYRQRITALPELYMTGSFADMDDYQLNRIGEAVRADQKGKDS